MKKLVTIFAVFGAFQVSAASVDSIPVPKLYGSKASIIVTEDTIREGLLQSRAADKLSPEQLACLDKNLELLSAALDKPENRARLAHFGPRTQLEISVRIPQSVQTAQLLKSGNLYVNGNALGFGLTLGNDGCNLVTPESLDKEFMKIEVKAKGIELSFSNEAQINQATEGVKAKANSILSKAGNLK